MSPHLSLKSVPELARLPWLKRNLAYRRCLRQRAPWSWWTYYMIVVMLVVAVVSFTLTRSSLPRWSHPMISTVALVLAIVICETAMKYFFLRNRGEILRGFLLARCLYCGQNLRHLDPAQTTCPKCHNELTEEQKHAGQSSSA